MTTLNTFLTTAVITAALSFSHECLTAGDQEAAMAVPLAKSQGIAVVSGCDITGHLVKEADGKVYAVLKAVNPTADDVNANIHFAVTSMPETARFSRMVMMPTELKRDHWPIALTAKATQEAKILVYAPPQVAKATQEEKILEPIVKVEQLSATTADVLQIATQQTATMRSEWTLTISPAELPLGLGFGAAVVATPGDGKVHLEKGQFVLARTELSPLGAFTGFVPATAPKAEKQGA